MSSVGEISLLYINKAHVLNEAMLTRRMMLVYMASAIFSMILTPVFLRIFLRPRQQGTIKSNAAKGGSEIILTVTEMATVKLSRGSQEVQHTGNSRRRKKNHTSDEEADTLPV